MDLINARTAEHRKYDAAYRLTNYRMSDGRKNDVAKHIEALPVRGAYLDVSCGRGEMLALAKEIGFSTVQGTEIVPALIDGERIVRAEVHALPFADKTFDVATMLDVIEHLIPGDDELACRELVRVAKSHVILTANNLTSKKATGEELHINRRPYPEWDGLFRQWFPGQVTWLKGPRNHVSEIWRIDL